jgi:NDP-sugar pyrophosphorylase family protein
MAGAGTRFKNLYPNTPKPLIPINGMPMILRAIKTLSLEGQYIFVVQDNEQIKNMLSSYGEIIVAKELTQGPVCSALLARDLIDNKEPLIITNCDQILEWNVRSFKNWLNLWDPDGAIVTYSSDKEHNSFAKVENDLVIEIKEKEVISNISLNGIHYWRHGFSFVESADRMIEKKITVNNEYYIAPTYNELIVNGATIKNYHIPAKQHWAVGIPEDLQIYLDYHENKKTK